MVQKAAVFFPCGAHRSMVAFSDVLISWVQVYPVVNAGAYSILKGEIRSVKHTCKNSNLSYNFRPLIQLRIGQCQNFPFSWPRVLNMQG